MCCNKRVQPDNQRVGIPNNIIRTHRYLLLFLSLIVLRSSYTGLRLLMAQRYCILTLGGYPLKKLFYFFINIFLTEHYLIAM